MQALFKIADLGRKTLWRATNRVLLGVKLLLVRDGSILLVRHSYEPGWLLPGGGVKRGETLEEAIRREAAEELGAQLGELQLLGVYTSFAEGWSNHIVAFTCHEFSFSDVASPEIEARGFFEPGDLPADTTPATRRRIEEFLADHWVPQAAIW